MSKKDTIRVSSVAFPLYEDEFKNIPDRILIPKSKEGIRKHLMMQNAIESGFKNIPMTGIEAMFLEACYQIGIEPVGKCEEAMKGKLMPINAELTGHPDFYNKAVILDYKFTDELKNETALQTIGYDELLFNIEGYSRDLFAFHYPNDRILTVYQVKEAVKSILRDFYLKLIERHDEIRSSFSAKMWALTEWRKIQTDNEIFVPVCTIQPEIQIKTFDDANSAVDVLREMARLKKKEEALKVEINRFLDEKGIEKLSGGLKRSKYFKRNYNVPKNVKEQYEGEKSEVVKLTK